MKFILAALALLLSVIGADAQSFQGLMPANTAVCNPTGSQAIGQNCSSVIISKYTALQTSNWFATDSPSVNYIRTGDRVFIGDAINYPNNNTCGTGDWFTLYQNSTSNGPCAYIGSFQMVVETKVNNSNPIGGILTAGQSKQTSSATNGVFGIAAFALENKTGAGSRSGGSSWAIYGECNKIVDNGGNCYAMELDVMTAVNNTNNPDAFTQGAYVGAQIGCGSGVTTPTNFNCSSAIQVVKNSQPFRAGIVFLNGSLATITTSIGSFPVAMALFPNAGLFWQSSAGTTVGGFTFDSSGNFKLGTTSTIIINGVAAVDCAAGTVNGATIAITKGIVTHC